MIRFRCPHCKKPLAAKDHMAGKKASCTTCKKAVVIPTPATPTTSATGSSSPIKGDQPPAPTAAEIEELAAAAFTEEPAANGKAEAPATLDFTCEFCEATITAPVAEAGKRMQCTNAECRRLVKVPTPKEEKPKDWRELAKKGPTVAQMMQQDKIDDAAWGTQTDKVRAGSAALKEAGAIPDAPKVPIGVRGWIQRIMWTTGIAAVLVVAIFVGNRVRHTAVEKKFVDEMQKYVKPGPEMASSPVVRAEIFRAIAEYRIQEGKAYGALSLLQKEALASVPPQTGKDRPIESDLFLIELALTMTEVGGTEQEEIAKEKWSWKGRELLKALQSVLDAIKAPEAKVMAMRALASRLIEKEQLPLATSLAQLASNQEGSRRPPVTSQLIALMLLQEKSVDKLKDVSGVTRVGYAEFHARKGNYREAEKVAFADGPSPLDQLEACVGVAQVILQTKGTKAEAVPFVDEAVKIGDKQSKMPPWLMLQTIRVVARVKGSTAVPPDWLKALPGDFRPRGYLELLLADADTSTTALTSSALGDLKNANADSPSHDLAWSVLGRQNARLGRHDACDEARQPDNARFRPMAEAGAALGAFDPRR